MNEEMMERWRRKVDFCFVLFLISLRDFSFGVLAVGMRRDVKELGVNWICVHDTKFSRNQ